MSKNKSLLLGFFVGCFALILIAGTITGILLNNSTQIARADASSIFMVDASSSDTSFDYGDNKTESYPSTVFYATISDMNGNLIEVTECNFATGATNASVTSTLSIGKQYKVNIYGPTFLNILNVNIGIETITGTDTVNFNIISNLSNVKTFQFIYQTNLKIQFTDISITDDSWFTDYNDAAVTQTTTVTENA